WALPPAIRGARAPAPPLPLNHTNPQPAPPRAPAPPLDSLRQLQGASQLSGPLAVIGLATALWTASGYIGAFMRASNAIYDTEEGRPIWKTVPVQLGLTALMVVLLALCAFGVVVTGQVAERVGQWLGIGSAAVLVWDIAKWPVLAVLVSLAFALLYWAAPNAQQPGFRWLSPGSVLAVLLWIAASAGFAVYVANFGSYNKVYGSLGGVAVFLIWLWLSNIAVLLGAEFDAELARGRRIEQGFPPDEDPFLPPRDTRAMPDDNESDEHPGDAALTAADQPTQDRSR
ncbi:YihY/virulence factor BrkB family protein, partial [Nocardia brasiliensis]|uniref:YihY/virulence factor BrkB family protein n=1 Tax=Nocardia brasiliensis TaxID=37326 RepID=UPI0024540C6C